MVFFTQRQRYFVKRALDIFRHEGPGGLLATAAAVLRDRMIPKTYRRWILRYDRLGTEGRRSLASEIAGWSTRPSISVLMAVSPSDLPHLAAAVRSVARQLYPDRELCVVCEPSIREAVSGSSGEALSMLQIRIASGEGGETRSAALNRALKLANGDFIVLMDADDELAEQALYWVAKTIVAHPDVDLIFTDQDKIDGRGQRFDPWFKADWNPALMLSCDAFGRLGCPASRAPRITT